MSRRQSRIQPLPWNELPEAQWEQVSWWWDEIPGYPGYTWHDWQDAWTDITLSVVWSVWRNQGGRIYAVHRDKPLRDDLQSWLMLRAQEAASRFIPDPSHPAPEKQWGAFLSTTLTKEARYHFEDVIGAWKGAREAWNAGIYSTEHLDELEAETGHVIQRHALHGHPFGTEDPASVVIRIENLNRQLDDIERHVLRTGTYTVTSDVCITNLCTNPAKVRGLCDWHWRKERDLTGNLDRPCNVPDCHRTYKGRGLCAAHLDRWRRGTLPEDLVPYVEPEGRKKGPRPKDVITICSEEDCEKKAVAYGKCRKHRRLDMLAEAPPCNQDGCDRPAETRGMCSRCYQRWKAARARGETEAPR